MKEKTINRRIREGVHTNDTRWNEETMTKVSMKAMNQPAACDGFGENIKMLSTQ